MSFKIRRTDAEFAIGVAGKALASRTQEEVVYRSIRIQTAEASGKHYVIFSSNGGYHAVQTSAFETLEFKQDIDVLVECQKLAEVISKATVDVIEIEVFDEENISVTANGKNKIRSMPGETIPQFPVIVKDSMIGKMDVGKFTASCRMATPFATEDVHKAPLIGLCVDKNKMYATDEVKSITLGNVGLDFSEQLNFNTIALELLKEFDVKDSLEFHLAKPKSSDTYSHLVFHINGFWIFVLKYNTDYPSVTLDGANERCVQENSNFIKIPKTSALQILNRIAVFADDNDLLSLTPDGKGVNFEVLNAKTGESGVEYLECLTQLEPEVLERKLFVSLKDFRIVLDAFSTEEMALKFSSQDSIFLSVESDFSIAWLTTKSME
jgi:hypothetical protein